MKHLLAPALFAVAVPAATLAMEEGGMGGMAATAGMGAMAGAAQASHYAKQKVVYHVNYYDPKKQAGALRNIQNHINAVGADNLDAKVVLHGNGVALLLEPDGLEGSKMKEANATDEMQARISGLKNQGVAFNICANTLEGRKVDTAYLYDYSASDIVPSGVAELSHLQSQGYTYIKP